MLVPVSKCYDVFFSRQLHLKNYYLKVLRMMKVMLIPRMKNQLKLKSRRQNLMIFMNASKKLEGTALCDFFTFFLLGELPPYIHCLRSHTERLMQSNCKISTPSSYKFSQTAYLCFGH